MLLIRSVGALIFALVPVAAAAARPADEVPVRAIAIVVNGQELPRDPAPRMVGGRLLVPVIRIYSALGIAISRDGDEITASAPSKRIVVHIGSRSAQIDTRTVEMEAPAQTIDGATFVPLRFVADSLGAAVSFDKKAERVEVISTIVGRTPGLEQRDAAGTTQIVGTVSNVDLLSAPESITVVRGPSVRTISITSNAKITVQDVATRTEAPASLDDIHTGDAVSIVLRNDGAVDRVVARYASRSGTIAAVSGAQFVLQSGYVVTPDKSTAITLNGQPATLGDLKAGDSVTVRLNPDTGEKRQIIVSREVASTPQPAGSTAISSLTVNAHGALKAGDTFSVAMVGTPGGKASFDIGTYVTGIPMTEAQPGTYTAQYTVPAGVNFGHTTVYGHLTAGGVAAPRAEAHQLLAVTTALPQIVETAPANGQTVNNSRPSIYATYRTVTDIGINAQSAKIEVNGLDVTAAATRTDGFITYTPSAPLNDGTVNVSVSVSDNAGNTATRRFAFTVRTR